MWQGWSVRAGASPAPTIHETRNSFRSIVGASLAGSGGRAKQVDLSGRHPLVDAPGVWYTIVKK